MRKAVTRMLSIAGFKVEAFASAEECLASAVVAKADCFVCDIHLPGASGFALHRRLLNAGSTAQVIFMTGHDSPAARDKAARLGGAYLPKPFEGRDLIGAVKKATGSA